MAEQDLTGVSTFVGEIGKCQIGSDKAVQLTSDEMRKGQAKRYCREGGVMNLEIKVDNGICSADCIKIGCIYHPQ